MQPFTWRCDISQYCQPSDVTTYALPATAIPASITTGDINQACISASGEADSYMRARYSLPLGQNYPQGGPYTTYDPTLVRHTAYIAAFILMSFRGFTPMDGSDQMIRENYYKAVGWPVRPGSGYFPGIERQNIHPDVVQAGVTPPQYNLPQVWSSPPRFR